MAAKVCCDTSFLFSFHTNDTHTSAVHLALARAQRPITVSALNDFELLHSVQFAAFRGLLPPSDANAMVAAFAADLAGGKFDWGHCDLTDVVLEANRIALHHTPFNGAKSFDILHVAAALCVGATEFLSFDIKQRALAAAEGLAVLP